MKDREIFSGLTTTYPFILRLDGRSFHRFSKNRAFEKPYDLSFATAMADTARSLMEGSGLYPALAYTFSDEISLYLTRPVFENRVEKLVSVTAGFASSAFTLAANAGYPVAFDCRIVPVADTQLSAYLAWRQAEAWRNHINGYAHRLLTDTGLSAAAAQKKLDGMKSAELHELAFSSGINLAETLAWQRRGIAVYRKQVLREGYNPVTKEHVAVQRQVCAADWDLPLFRTPEGERWLAENVLFRDS
jgi:tRNA(His) 5'-end guanylyltransferase